MPSSTVACCAGDQPVAGAGAEQNIERGETSGITDAKKPGRGPLSYLRYGCRAYSGTRLDRFDMDKAPARRGR